MMTSKQNVMKTKIEQMGKEYNFRYIIYWHAEGIVQ